MMGVNDFNNDKDSSDEEERFQKFAPPPAYFRQFADRQDAL